MKIKYSKELLEPIVSQCSSFRQVLIKLGLREAGGNYENIQTRIKNYEISTLHFLGKGHNKGRTWSVDKNIEHRLVDNSTYSTGQPVSSHRLKLKILKFGIKEHICEECENVEWLGKKIPLELHHINGNRFDNRIENLKLLCPNCHTFTDNYRSKNKLSAFREI